jgi:hypothetical protein
MARDPYRVPPHQRPTNQLRRDDVAPETRPALSEAQAIARETEDGIVTQTRCPLCVGSGMVTPEIAVTFDQLVEQAKDRA